MSEKNINNDPYVTLVNAHNDAMLYANTLRREIAEYKAHEIIMRCCSNCENLRFGSCKGARDQRCSCDQWAMRRFAPETHDSAMERGLGNG